MSYEVVTIGAIERSSPAAAERALLAFEAVPVGGLCAEAREAAEAALAALRASARAEVSTGIEPIGTDALADFEFFTAACRRTHLADDMAAIHATCVESHPALARVLRSDPVTRLVGDSVSPDLAAAEQNRYLALCAAELWRVDSSASGARLLAVDLPALEARYAAAAARHAAHAQAEIDRLAREQHEAAAAVEAVERARRSDLAGFFAARPGMSFVIRGVLFSGAALAAAAQRQAARNQDGNFAQVAIEELEAARASVVAVTEAAR